jgi:glucokinase
VRPTFASLAVAAPVGGDIASLTNLAWTFTRDELQAAAGAKGLLLLNDFEALALSLPQLSAGDLHRIGGGEPEAGGSKAVLGPGTGLGVAGLLSTPSGWTAIASEGGHVSFAPETAEELAIIENLIPGARHLSAERLISGPGLVRLYGRLAEMRGRSAEMRAASQIAQAAFAGADPSAAEALERFVLWLGRFTGDIALVFAARGGVYLGGGIAPKILPALSRGAFRKAFESKGRMEPVLRSIPVNVITATDAGLRGAVAALARLA